MTAAAVAVATLTEAQRREAWLEDRRSCITGTDVAAILGLSRFSSPVQVYLDKKGLATVEENEAMRWGKRLERPILEAYSERMESPLVFADPFKLHRVPDFPLLGASLDAVRIIDNAPVDAKNTRQRGADWGPDGSDQIPVYYAAQLAVQMMVQGTEFADLAVLFSGQEFANYRVYRDTETEAMIKQRVAVWWERHIVQDVPPEIDGSDSSSRYIAQRFAKHTDKVAEVTPEVREWIRQRAEADARLKTAEADKKTAENRIKLYMGDASSIPGLCTWKNNRDSEVIDWESIAADAIAAARYTKTEELALISKYTNPKPGARVLRITAKEA